MDTDRPDLPRPLARMLFGLFFVSGVCGLMYEVVWVRLLTRVLGSTSYATATVLAVFMGGLALGSYLAGRFVDRAARPLRWYARLEVAVACTALLSLALPEMLLPLYRMIYEAAGGSRPVLVAGQVTIAALVLLLPTMLMGATLPTLCAFGGRTFGHFGRGVATLYAVNTLGALVGCLAAGFVLLGTVGESLTVFLGAILNVLVAAAAMRLEREVGTVGAVDVPDAKPEAVPAPTVTPARDGSAALRWAVLLAFGANGFIALASEVIWGRMLVLYQGTSIYAFSSMLGAVLGGIGIGSYWMGRKLDTIDDPFRAYARVQILSGVAGLVALQLFALLGGMAQPSFLTGTNLKVLLTAPVLLLGPISVLWGAGFPLAARCYSRAAGRAGREISELYAWNTLGSILGALAGGFVFLSAFGVSRAGVILSLASVAVGGLLLVMDQRRRTAGAATPSKSLRFSLGMIAAALVLAFCTGDVYYRVIETRMRKRVAGHTDQPMTLYRHTESATGTTTAFGPYKQLWVNGEGMTHLCVETKLMAHLPLALSGEWKAGGQESGVRGQGSGVRGHETDSDPSPLTTDSASTTHHSPLTTHSAKVCVICCGMGTSLKSVVVHEGVEAWVVELLPDVFDTVKFFHPDVPDLLTRPSVHPVADDGRNYLQMNDRRYDVITVDPAPPFYSAGTVNLYTREFFELAQGRLTDGGVFCLWIPPWEEREIRYVMRTYLDVFEHVSVWSGPGSDGFPKGFYLLGRRGRPFDHVAERVRALYRDPAVVADLREWDRIVDEPAELLALRLTDGPELRSALGAVPVMTDDRPYTEFPLLRSLRVREPQIFTGDVLRQQIAELRRNSPPAVAQRAR